MLSYFLLVGLFVAICLRGRHGGARAYAEGGIAAAVALFLAGLTEFNFGDTEVLLTMLDLMAIVLIGIESSATTATVADRSIDSSAQIAQAHA